MNYLKIGLGNVPEDGLGDGLRTAGGKVNANFEELYLGGSWIDGYFTRKAEGNISLSAHEVGDVIEGWTDANETKFIKAVIDSLPFDGNTGSGLFIIYSQTR